jgi:hypothetical protein
MTEEPEQPNTNHANPAESTSPLGTYQVGYGRPPVASRFKPGQSGNGKGRPKALKSAKSVVNAIANSKIAVTENGKRKKRTMREIAIFRMFELAVKGDKGAITAVINLMDRYEPVAPDEKASEADQQVNRELLLSAIARFQKKTSENSHDH